MQIKMEPQSSQTLQPKSDRSVTQAIVLNNPNKVRNLNPLLIAIFSNSFYKYRNLYV
jgi:hypothetical protein